MRRLLTRHWLGMHALVVLAVAGFLTLGWWQAIRAGDGNARSYGYALEWPTFAGIVIVLWIRAMRTELRTPPGANRATTSAYDVDLFQPPPEPISAETDPELAAYNEYLADLNERDLQARR